jgi:hypothetical protein
MSDETATPAPAASTEPAKAAEEASGSRLSKAEWAEIEAHWEYDTMSGVEIAKKYGVTGAALSRHFKKHGIFKGSKKALTAAAAAATASVKAAATTAAVSAATPAAVAAETFESKKRDRTEQTKEQAYRASQANFVIFSRVQRDMLAFGAAPGAVPPGATAISPADAANMLKALRHAESFIETNIGNRYRLLDVDTSVDETKLPPLIFKDLSKEDIEEMRTNNGDDEDGDLAELPGVDPDDVVVVESEAE